jgi:hypothetical protein
VAAISVANRLAEVAAKASILPFGDQTGGAQLIMQQGE